MSRKLLLLSVATVALGNAAHADAPNVVADIAPIHSLVARVMDGVGTPALIMQQGASPHEYALRPSEAAALQEADLVFWMGADLSPWMENAVETLSNDASVTAFLERDETLLLEFRESALFEAHAHDDHDDHVHYEHDDHAHDDHDDHAHDDHDDHAHGDHDPHAWLSPMNAAAWLNVIAAEMSAADPDNASTYFSNAAAGQAELDALTVEINGILDPVRGGSFIVFHDAYQYFETAFDFPASGAISLSDASDPSPARIAEIQARVRDGGVDCVLAEPQFNQGLAATVLDGTSATTAVIDPIGVTLELGPMLYPDVIRGMATTLAECLGD